MYSLRGQVIGLGALLRCLRTRYDGDLAGALRHAAELRLADDVVQQLQSTWDDIRLLTAADLANSAGSAVALRRLFFWCIRPERLFNEENTTLVDVYRRAAHANEQSPGRCRRYELRRFSGELLGFPVTQALRALRCWCPSTLKEHWILVSPGTTTARQALTSIYGELRGKPLYVKRQGDVVVAYMGRSWDRDTPCYINHQLAPHLILET